MIAILSCTHDDLYRFNLPFAIYSWGKLGVTCCTFMPAHDDDVTDAEHDRRILVARTMRKLKLPGGIFLFSAPPDKQATYAQCIRLYAAGIPEIGRAEVLVTADADMCVFNREYWERLEYNGAVNIIGADLVPQGQVPMCYIAMPATGWRSVMKIGARTPQQCVDDLLGPIEAENFRGNYWAKDQEVAYNHIFAGAFPIVCHNRAIAPGVQFATRRADRDGWQVTPDIIDAHMPRPGYTDAHFSMIYNLFQTMYPNDDHRWMYQYLEEYLKLVE